MAASTKDPLQGIFFGLKIDDVEVGVFTGCSGLGLEINVAKQAQVTSTGKHFERKIPGRHNYTPLVLKRGITNRLDLHDWFQQVVDGHVQGALKTIGITVLDSMMEVKAEFSLDRCWPSKLSVNDLNASSDEILVEEITIIYEEFDWK